MPVTSIMMVAAIATIVLAARWPARTAGTSRASAAIPVPVPIRAGTGTRARAMAGAGTSTHV
jgi:hypothetical protein